MASGGFSPIVVVPPSFSVVSVVTVFNSSSSSQDGLNGVKPILNAMGFAKLNPSYWLLAVVKAGHNESQAHVGFTASTKLVSMKVAKSGTRLICFNSSMWSA